MKILSQDGNSTTIETECPVCHVVKTITVSSTGLLQLQSGLEVSKALPTLSAMQHEQLLIGVCEDCLAESYC